MRNLWWYPSSKGKALGLAILWSVFTLTGIYLTFSNTMPACGFCTWIFFFLALGYGLIYFFRVNGDKRLSEQALYERVPQNASSAPEYGVAARKTTPGSGYIGLDFTRSQPPESV